MDLNDAIAEERKQLIEKRRQITDRYTAELVPVDAALAVLDSLSARINAPIPGDATRAITMPAGVIEAPIQQPPANGLLRLNFEFGPTVARRVPTTVAVLRCIRENPNGLTVNEVVDRIKGQIKTKSEDPKRVIHNTLINLVNRQLLERVDGRYRLSPMANSTNVAEDVSDE